jgi:hypothetical protein
LAHPEWLEELAAIMQERLVHRRVPKAGLHAASSQPLLAQIRHNFFGGLQAGWS